MRYLLVMLACALAVSLCGCSQEEKPKAHTVTEIQAQIDKVQNDSRIPDQAKGMILGHLQHEKELAQKQPPSTH